jgi:competence protein ComEC
MWRFAQEYPRHLLALALVVGLTLGGTDRLWQFACACLVTIVLVALRARPDIAIAAAALLVLGGAIGAARLAAIDADPLAELGDGRVAIRGHLVDLPRANGVGADVTTSLRVREVRTGQLLRVSTRAPVSNSHAIGDEVFLRGRLQAVSPGLTGDDAGESYARYLLRSGVRRQMFAREVVSTGAWRGGPLGAIDSIRRRAERALRMGLAREPAALLRGMVLGGDAGLSEATQGNFRIVGLAHILAVSGQNVLLIVILVRAMLMGVGAGRRTRLIVPALLIAIYVLLCGAQASVIRAGAMGLAGLAALAASRRSSRIYALILAAIIVLTWNPRAYADVGAQLSFAAVLGIMAFTGPIAGRLGRWPRWAAEAFAATAGATIATAPLMAFHFQAVSVVSLLANVLAEPLVGPIVWLGSLTAFLGQFSVSLAALLGAPNQFLLATLISLAELLARLPGAQVGADWFGVRELAVSSIAVVVAAGWANGRWRVGRKARGGSLTRAPAFLACGVLAVVIVWPALTPGGRPLRGPAVAMIDVGQGDAALYTDGRCNALIDGGKPGSGVIEKLKKLGVRRLDALLVSHPDDDHYGGALDIAEEGSPRVNLFIDGGGSAPAPGYERMRRGFAARGVRTVTAERGVNWTCGELGIRLIGPEPQAPGASTTSSTNERAAVALITVAGLQIFASGDAESPVLRDLPLEQVDILKVSHHGSADEGLPDLLTRLRPKVALIGVGANNHYGHPTPETLSALDTAGVSVYRTDRDGTVVLRPTAAGRLDAEFRR